MSCCFVLVEPTWYRVQGFPQGPPHPFFAHPRRELHGAPLFLADHCKVPGTTIRGSQWGAPRLALRRFFGPEKVTQLRRTPSSHSSRRISFLRTLLALNPLLLPPILGVLLVHRIALE